MFVDELLAFRKTIEVFLKSMTVSLPNVTLIFNFF